MSRPRTPDAAATLQRRAFEATCKRLRRVWLGLQDGVHDRRLGVRTARITPALGNPEVQAEGHMGTPYSILGTIARHMDANRIAVPRFVDIGCGLGRPLFYFANRFEDLLGFEIAASLYAGAQEQLVAARERNPACARIAIRQADATVAVPLDRPAVLFLFNPFGPKPMARLCERIRSSEHELHIYYVNPAWGDVMASGLGRPADSRLPGWFETLYFQIPGGA